MHMQLQAAQPLASARAAVAAGSARPCAGPPLRQPRLCSRQQGRRALRVVAAQGPQEQRSLIQQRRLDTMARIDDIFEEEVKELESVSAAAAGRESH